MAYNNSSFIFGALANIFFFYYGVQIKIIVLIYDCSDTAKNRFEG